MNELAPLVIVAEDEPIIRLIVVMGLEECGFRVLEAADGYAAWDYLKEVECSLLVSDIRMPGMDGYALAENVLALEKHPPILLLTGYSDPIPPSLKNRITLLQKPVPVEELCERAKSLCRNPEPTKH